MMPFAPRLLLGPVVGVLAWLMPAGASAAKSPIRSPDKLVVLSTTDVKGEYQPCG
jgi:hypothetical protein